jgi:arginase
MLGPMPGLIVLAGSPTSLGGHFDGMDRAPAELRARGLVGRLVDRPGLGLVDAPLIDAGDAPVEPGWAPDPDPRMKNKALLIENLPRISAHVRAALEAGGSDPRLLLVGGDCTSHPAAIAGLRAARPGTRLAMAWFDAHGDFNTPETTPSGNVWGMPFAMACGRGDPGLVAAVDGPTVSEADTALLGGQVLDETESRMLAASAVAHFGAGMLATDAGRAALAAWAGVVADRVDGLYVAFDLDALDGAEGWAVATPEPDGLSLADAVEAVRILASAMPVVGFGATAARFEERTPPEDAARTVEAIAILAEAALGE